MSIIENIIEKYSNFSHSINEKEIFDALEKLLSFLRLKKIIIYGAGSLGNIMYRLLSKYNLPIDCYIDRAADKIKNINNIKVYTPDYLSIVNGNEYIVIVAINTKSLCENIKKTIKQINKDVFLIDGFELSRILKYPECLQKHKNNQDFNLVECIKCGFEERGCPFCFSFIRKISYKKKQDIEGSKKFDWLGYIMGQYCTLKCKFCCEAVPYLSNPAFTPAKTIVSDLKKIANACEFVRYVELVGGEPFLHPEFKKILEQLLTIENIGYIKIFTNGTIVPNDSLCKLLKNPRIVIHISNYFDNVSDDFKNNILETMKKLDENNIDYIFIKGTNWLDFSSFNFRNLPNSELEKAFARCFLSHCHRLYNGILYRCPHQYAGVQIGKLSLKEGEYVDINKLGIQDLAYALEKFEELKFIDACRFCNMPFDAPEIPSGEQLQ